MLFVLAGVSLEAKKRMSEGWKPENWKVEFAFKIEYQPTEDRGWVMDGSRPDIKTGSGNALISSPI